MERNFEKILFEFINGYGPAFGDNFCIINNTGKNAGSSIYYRVFMKGGISFDISGGNEEYGFTPVWEGPFNINTAQHVLAVLTIMGHSFTKPKSS